MSKSLRPSQIIKQFRTFWNALPDPRQASNSTKHLVVDALILAFAVFFFQHPSFLASQRDLAKRKGRDNTATLFETTSIPSDNQIRNIADLLSPPQFNETYYWIHDELEANGFLESYQELTGTYLLAADGVNHHHSTEICCPNCTTRRDTTGQTHYRHSSLMVVMVNPDSPHVLPLPPECIVPQDGHDKQDCEQQAIKRWLAQHLGRYEAHHVTMLGDDLYSRVPLCELIAETHQQYFFFVCKPTSHKELYQTLETLAEVGGIEHKQLRHWNASQRRGEIWTYRFVNEVPLTGAEDTLWVNWLELIITEENTGMVIFKNSWVSNHYFGHHNVVMWAKVGRARWKIENEGINVLKEQGYHLEHNFGHGSQNLANVLFVLNILAFLVHTVLHLAYEVYRLLRAALVTRKRFFEDIKTLTTYMIFDSWNALFEFMADGLELSLSP